MGDRYYSRDKGSSRSTRDDSRSRTYDHERERGRLGGSSSSTRSRSRSPRTQHSPDSRASKHTSERRRDHNEHERRHSSKSHDYIEEVPPPPPPPRITKISIDFSKSKVAPIKMSLGGSSKSTAAPKPTIASVFNDDDDDEDEPEQMPAEARMRMRNIGRETPTSAGPNSFGKTKQGFCDAKKVFEKNLKQALESEQKYPVPKFPQTIYKIKGP